jgi:glycosyltransferase involved in cell wall biosynthesis
MALDSDSARSLTIIVPSYDEEGRLGTTVAGILAAAEQVLDSFEVIIVDDGSRDGTAKIADELAANHANISVIHHPTNRGVGAAYRSALQVARYPLLTLVPGDNAFESNCLPAFFATVGRADIVISYRANPEARTPIRRLLSITCTAMLRLATGVPLRDGHSLYIWSVEKARRVSVPDDYRYHLTTLCALLAESSTYAQIPVQLTPKPDASSRVLRPRIVFLKGWMMLRLVAANAFSAQRARPRQIAIAQAEETTDGGVVRERFSQFQEAPSPP